MKVLHPTSDVNDMSIMKRWVCRYKGDAFLEEIVVDDLVRRRLVMCNGCIKSRWWKWRGRCKVKGVFKHKSPPSNSPHLFHECISTSLGGLLVDCFLCILLHSYAPSLRVHLIATHSHAAAGT
jgi:hypothetical protein